MAEGEELGSNLLHVAQRTPANSGAVVSGKSTGQEGRRAHWQGPARSVLGKASGRNAGQTAPAGGAVWPVEQLGTPRWRMPVRTVLKYEAFRIAHKPRGPYTITPHLLLPGETGPDDFPGRLCLEHHRLASEKDRQTAYTAIKKLSPDDAGGVRRRDARAVGRGGSATAAFASDHAQDRRERRARGPSFPGTVTTIAAALMDRIQAVLSLTERRRPL
jgi:hypothetical protein